MNEPPPQLSIADPTLTSAPLLRPYQLELATSRSYGNGALVFAALGLFAIVSSIVNPGSAAAHNAGPNQLHTFGSHLFGLSINAAICIWAYGAIWPRRWVRSIALIFGSMLTLLFSLAVIGSQLVK